ncbi:phosphotransferase [Mesoplasma lactucae]|uniref:Uncharacterized protein n=1 Tax=Mesoplasma lactucae ATCC 49193 TaxID=81460 RepID=A0A291IRT2_9MOLU|nr:phosphotransferase [Mesoplasma lactucae]ATG97448.1 hypothetical protein CP520_01585 [Mesoplasma lactucae ATCC 49193]ATZ20097.1 choline kinase [Mesoplasma lactucae ATCC 49193]MCL8216845.1 hypothetical protein [Mesoplasma lactucae ATCC 49193]
MKTPQGLTNEISLKNNIMTKTSNKYVDYFLNRKAEASLYEQLKSKKNLDFILHPIKWGFNPDKTFYSEWIYYSNAYTFVDKPAMLQDDEVLKKVITTIEKYHEIEVDMPMFQPHDYLEKFRSKIKNPLIDLSSYESKLNEVISRFFDGDFKIVLSHNDMVPGNFLFVDNELKFIDFEYSLKNIYLFDFGGFITETLPVNKFNDFMNLLNLNQKEKDKLSQLVFYQYILWINWSTYMYETSNKDVYRQLAYLMKEKLDNFNNLTF